MLTGTNQQIVSAFETEGMKPEEIAVEFELDPVAVKATLMQFSPIFRDSIKTDKSLDFHDNDLLDANDTIVRIMRHTEDENLALRAAKYVRDDKKGRLDVLSGLGKININIAVFNQRLLEARQAKAQSKLVSNSTTEALAPRNAAAPVNIDEEAIEA
jgi:hypothetical protein